MERNPDRQLTTTGSTRRRPFIYRSADHDGRPHPLRRSTDNSRTPHPQLTEHCLPAALLLFRVYAQAEPSADR